MKTGEHPEDGKCESCLFYDYDPDWDCEICTLSMDEDDCAALTQNRSVCPYYRYYQEYKSVQKQN